MKPYAVVAFINDGLTEFESTSEVPSSWITSNLKHCWWPNTKNVGPPIIRKTLPDETSPNKWQLHDVKLIGFYDDISTAHQKADGMPSSDEAGEFIINKVKQSNQLNILSSIIEENDTVKYKKRKSKVQRKKQEDYPTSDESTEMLDENKNIASPPQLLKVNDCDSNANNVYDIDVFEETLPIPTPAKGIKIRSNIPVSTKLPVTKMTTEYTQNEEKLSYLNNNIEVCNDDNINSISFPLDTSGRDYFIDIKAVLLQFEGLTVLINEMSQKIANKLGILTFEMKNITERLDTIERIVNCNQLTMSLADDHADLRALLPLQTVEHVQEFESHLLIGDVRNRFISHLSQIGGNSAKECITRILSRVFGPAAAKQSSWCEQRGNFKVGSLAIMGAVKDAVKNRMHVRINFSRTKERSGFVRVHKNTRGS